MTATDELRKMLDERGVKWEDYSDGRVVHTSWNNLSCWFNEFPDGWTAWGMSKHGTPEQAITATLSPGTCHMSIIDEYEQANGDESYQYECSECGSQNWEPAHDLPLYCRMCGRKVEQ